MISHPVWINSKTATDYFFESKDNYYQKSGEIGCWQGKGAKLLGLEGSIDINDFTNILAGKDKEGNQLVEVKEKDGNRKRAGLDLTFSAPKSVSILYEALKKFDEDKAKQIQKAHEDAVEKILEKIEENYAYTRIGKDFKKEMTKNLIIAKFTHDIARPVKKDEEYIVDPALHTHAVIMNMTKSNDGKFRTIESLEIFKNYMAMGQLYRNELAANLKELGIDIKVTDPDKGFFEIVGIDDNLINEFSNRSEQINETEILKELKEKYPNKSLSELKQMAAYKTREYKGEIDREKVREKNIQRMQNIGYDKDFFTSLFKTSILQNENKENLAIKAVKNAIKALTEQESIFTKEKVLDKAAKLTLNNAIRLEELEKAFDKTQKENSPLKPIKIDNRLYSTKEILESEKYILNALKGGKNKIFQPISLKEAKEKVEKYSKNLEKEIGVGLTNGQKRAAKLILSSTDQIIGIQGDAGTGKTTMLKAVNYLKNKDTKIIGLSFTGKAASEIEKRQLVNHLMKPELRVLQ